MVNKTFYLKCTLFTQQSFETIYSDHKNESVTGGKPTETPRTILISNTAAIGVITNNTVPETMAFYLTMRGLCEQ